MENFDDYLNQVNKKEEDLRVSKDDLTPHVPVAGTEQVLKQVVPQALPTPAIDCGRIFLKTQKTLSFSLPAVCSWHQFQRERNCLNSRGARPPRLPSRSARPPSLPSAALGSLAWLT